MFHVLSQKVLRNFFVVIKLRFQLIKLLFAFVQLLLIGSQFVLQVVELGGEFVESVKVFVSGVEDAILERLIDEKGEVELILGFGFVCVCLILLQTE